MRVDPNYIANLANSLDQAQVNQQQLTAELSSGVRVNSLSRPGCVWRKCIAAEPDATG